MMKYLSRYQKYKANTLQHFTNCSPAPHHPHMMRPKCFKEAQTAKKDLLVRSEAWLGPEEGRLRLILQFLFKTYFSVLHTAPTPSPGPVPAPPRAMGVGRTPWPALLPRISQIFTGSKQPGSWTSAPVESAR